MRDFTLIRVSRDQVWFGDGKDLYGLAFTIGRDLIVHGYLTLRDRERVTRLLTRRRFTGRMAVRGVIATGISPENGYGRDAIYHRAAEAMHLGHVAYFGHKGTRQQRRDLRDAWSEVLRLSGAHLDEKPPINQQGDR